MKIVLRAVTMLLTILMLVTPTHVMAQEEVTSETDDETTEIIFQNEDLDISKPDVLDPVLGGGSSGGGGGGSPIFPPYVMVRKVNEQGKPMKVALLVTNLDTSEKHIVATNDQGLSNAIFFSRQARQTIGLKKPTQTPPELSGPLPPIGPSEAEIMGQHFSHEEMGSIVETLQRQGFAPNDKNPDIFSDNLDPVFEILSPGLIPASHPTSGFDPYDPNNPPIHANDHFLENGVVKNLYNQEELNSQEPVFFTKRTVNTKDKKGNLRLHVIFGHREAFKNPQGEIDHMGSFQPQMDYSRVGISDLRETYTFPNMSVDDIKKIDKDKIQKFATNRLADMVNQGQLKDEDFLHYAYEYHMSFEETNLYKFEELRTSTTINYSLKTFYIRNNGFGNAPSMGFDKDHLIYHGNWIQPEDGGQTPPPHPPFNPRQDRRPYVTKGGISLGSTGTGSIYLINKDDNGNTLQTAFRATNLGSGESHIVVTNKFGASKPIYFGVNTPFDVVKDRGETKQSYDKSEFKPYLDNLKAQNSFIPDNQKPDILTGDPNNAHVVYPRTFNHLTNVNSPINQNDGLTDPIQTQNFNIYSHVSFPKVKLSLTITYRTRLEFDCGGAKPCQKPGDEISQTYPYDIDYQDINKLDPAAIERFAKNRLAYLINENKIQIEWQDPPRGVEYLEYSYTMSINPAAQPYDNYSVYKFEELQTEKNIDKPLKTFYVLNNGPDQKADLALNEEEISQWRTSQSGSEQPLPGPRIDLSDNRDPDISLFAAPNDGEKKPGPGGGSSGGGSSDYVPALSKDHWIFTVENELFLFKTYATRPSSYGSKVLQRGTETKVTDKIIFDLLSPGKTYEFRGKLIHKETQTEVPTSTPILYTLSNLSSPKGEVRVDLTFDSSQFKENDEFVITYDIYEDGKLAGFEHDLNNSDQTFTIKDHVPPETPPGTPPETPPETPPTTPPDNPPTGYDAGVGFYGLSALASGLALIFLQKKSIKKRKV